MLNQNAWTYNHAAAVNHANASRGRNNNNFSSNMGRGANGQMGRGGYNNGRSGYQGGYQQQQGGYQQRFDGYQQQYAGSQQQGWNGAQPASSAHMNNSTAPPNGQMQAASTPATKQASHNQR
jgi:hypothetical protein